MIKVVSNATGVLPESMAQLFEAWKLSWIEYGQNHVEGIFYGYHLGDFERT